MATQSCRYYEQKYPKVDEVVVVEVKSIEQMGAYVALKEYNDIEGMILLSELSRRRIRSINKIIRVGRLEICVVLRVDEEKGYIDLSKRRVSEEDVAKCEERYNKAKAVHSIIRHVADSSNSTMEELYKMFGWPLYHKFGHAYDGFKIVLTEPNVLEPFNIPQQMKERLVATIKSKLTPQPVRIRADIEVTCFEYDGIDAVKRALTKGVETSTPELPIKIRLVAPPLYVVTTTSVDKQQGIDAVERAIAAVREQCAKDKGEVNIQVQARAVQERDDKDLSTLMAKLEKANREPNENDDGEEDDEEASTTEDDSETDDGKGEEDKGKDETIDD